MKWVRLRSWHIRGYVDDQYTLCGRYTPPAAPTLEEFPEDEKTCESCLRIEARRPA